jgi:hypothetical protein
MDKNRLLERSVFGSFFIVFALKVNPVAEETGTYKNKNPLRRKGFVYPFQSFKAGVKEITYAVPKAFVFHDLFLLAGQK